LFIEQTRMEARGLCGVRSHSAPRYV